MSTKKCLYLLILLMPMGLILAQNQTTEYMLKAGFIKQFTHFIEWPEQPALNDTIKPYIIAVLGDNPFGDALEDIFSKNKVKDKNVEIVYISRISQIESAHILFIPQQFESQLQTILEQANALNALTISDTQGFGKSGVMINFFLESNKIRFEINKKSIDEQGLTVSHLLLSYAKVI